MSSKIVLKKYRFLVVIEEDSATIPAQVHCLLGGVRYTLEVCELGDVGKTYLPRCIVGSVAYTRPWKSENSVM